MKFRSVRFKVSILYTSILGVILLAYSLLLYFNLSRVVYNEIDVNLKKKLTEIEDTITLYSNAFEADKEDASVSLKRTLNLEEQENNEIFQWPSIKKLDQMWRVTVQALGINQDFIVIYTPNGEVVEESNNIDYTRREALQSNFRMTPLLRTSINNIADRNQELRVITRPLYRMGKLKYIIQLATPTQSHHLLLRSKMKLILVTIPIFLLLTSFLGVFFVKRVFKPVTQIIQTAQQISVKDMSKRIEAQHTDDEIKSLVEAFNDMITRLEKSFLHIDEFSSNVAHELKTPLAIIRGELEVALRKERSAQGYQKAIQVTLEEIQRVLKTVNDLLLLAKLDYRTEAFQFEPTELNEFLEEIQEQSKFMAIEKNLTITLTPADQKLIVSANKLHLRRLFLNLLDNAIKYTPPGGKVDIRLTRNANQAQIAICDTGIGIKKENIAKIFNRFFYSESSDQITSSAGLGLSLVQSIAKIHHAAITVTSQIGQGSVFTVLIPLA